MSVWPIEKQMRKLTSGRLLMTLHSNLLEFGPQAFPATEITSHPILLLYLDHGPRDLLVNQLILPEYSNRILLFQSLHRSRPPTPLSMYVASYLSIYSRLYRIDMRVF